MILFAYESCMSTGIALPLFKEQPKSNSISVGQTLIEGDLLSPIVSFTEYEPDLTVPLSNTQSLIVYLKDDYPITIATATGVVVLKSLSSLVQRLEEEPVLMISAPVDILLMSAALPKCPEWVVSKALSICKENGIDNIFPQGLEFFVIQKHIRVTTGRSASFGSVFDSARLSLNLMNGELRASFEIDDDELLAQIKSSKLKIKIDDRYISYLDKRINRTVVGIRTFQNEFESISIQKNDESDVEKAFREMLENSKGINLEIVSQFYDNLERLIHNTTSISDREIALALDLARELSDAYGTNVSVKLLNMIQPYIKPYKDSNPRLYVKFSRKHELATYRKNNPRSSEIQSELLQFSRHALGDKHPETLETFSDYAFALSQEQGAESALKVFREIHELLDNVSPVSVVLLNRVQSNIGDCLRKLELFDESCEFYERVLQRRLSEHPKNDSLILLTRMNLAGTHGESAKKTGIERELKLVQKEFDKIAHSSQGLLGVNHSTTLQASATAAYYLAEAGDPRHSIKQLKILHRRVKNNADLPNIESLILHNIGFAYLELGKPKPATKYLSKAITVSEKAYGPNNAQATKSRSMLPSF